MTIETYLLERGAKEYSAADGRRIYIPFHLVSQLVEFWVPRWNEDESPRWWGGEIRTDKVSAWTQSLRSAGVFWDVERQRWSVRYAAGPWVDRLWDRLIRIEKMIKISNDESRTIMAREAGEWELECLVPGPQGGRWKRLKGDPIKDAA